MCENIVADFITNSFVVEQKLTSFLSKHHYTSASDRSLTSTHTTDQQTRINWNTDAMKTNNKADRTNWLRSRIWLMARCVCVCFICLPHDRNYICVECLRTFLEDRLLERSLLLNAPVVLALTGSRAKWNEAAEQDGGAGRREPSSHPGHRHYRGLMEPFPLPHASRRREAGYPGRNWPTATEKMLVTLDTRSIPLSEFM